MDDLTITEQLKRFLFGNPLDPTSEGVLGHSNPEYAAMSKPGRMMMRWGPPDPYMRVPANKWDVQPTPLAPREMQNMVRYPKLFDYHTNYGRQGP